METQRFQHFRGRRPPRFAHPSEQELAELLDAHGIAWDYEPHTFPLRHGPDGTVTAAFTPDFFLPEADMYIELTTQRRVLGRRKRRKVREATARHGLLVTLHERHHLERLRRHARGRVRGEGEAGGPARG